MDKEKMINNLLDIRKLTGIADTTASEKMINLFNIQRIVSQTIDELHSRSCMPEVFDNWMRPLKEINTDVMSAVTQLDYLGMHGDKIDKNSINGKLYKWISSSPMNYVRCLEAIIHGYEVK